MSRALFATVAMLLAATAGAEPPPPPKPVKKSPMPEPPLPPKVEVAEVSVAKDGRTVHTYTDASVTFRDEDGNRQTVNLSREQARRVRQAKRRERSQ